MCLLFSLFIIVNALWVLNIPRQNIIGHICFSVENREMKGTDCRLNLIKVAHLLWNWQESAEGRRLYSMVMALVEIQKAAYATESDRTPKSILRLYNQAFKFSLLSIELLSDPKCNSLRAIFGMPYHCLTIHLPEMLRLVSGRSIVAEHAERQFNKIR